MNDLHLVIERNKIHKYSKEKWSSTWAAVPRANRQSINEFELGRQCDDDGMAFSSFSAATATTRKKKESALAAALDEKTKWPWNSAFVLLIFLLLLFFSCAVFFSPLS